MNIKLCFPPQEQAMDGSACKKAIFTGISASHHEWVSGWVNEWVNEKWVSERMNEQVNEWVSEWMHEKWVSEWMNE